MSMPGPAPSVYSPFSRCGMPTANSHDFEAALDVAGRIRDGLAMLARQQRCQLFLVAVEECDEIQHHARADLRVARRPLRLGGGGICHRGGEFVARCERDAGLNLAGVGVEDIAEATALAGDASAGDEMPQFLDHDLIAPAATAGLLVFKSRHPNDRPMRPQGGVLSRRRPRRRDSRAYRAAPRCRRDNRSTGQAAIG